MNDKEIVLYAILNNWLILEKHEEEWRDGWKDNFGNSGDDYYRTRTIKSINNKKLSLIMANYSNDKEILKAIQIIKLMHDIK